MTSSYLETVRTFYDDIAKKPETGACCAQRNDVELAGLVVPPRMAEMSYSCGSTVHPDDMTGSPTVLYVGVGGGLEALQFAFFSRRPGGVIAVDPSPAMRAAAAENLAEAARLNDWLDPAFVTILEGDAFTLPVADASVDLVAQNCLFNMFRSGDLDRALAEVARVLKPGGRLMMSDPVAPYAIPVHLANDDRLRALCLSGALTYEGYIGALAKAGFRRIEVRARRLYRTLAAAEYGLTEDLRLDSYDTVSFKAASADEPLHVFTGRRAVYGGLFPFLDHGGQRYQRDKPVPVSDQTAAELEAAAPGEVQITAPTWRVDAGAEKLRGAPLQSCCGGGG